jgi:hypothetical protein
MIGLTDVRMTSASEPSLGCFKLKPSLLVLMSELAASLVSNPPPPPLVSSAPPTCIYSAFLQFTPYPLAAHRLDIS